VAAGRREISSVKGSPQQPAHSYPKTVQIGQWQNAGDTKKVRTFSMVGLSHAVSLYLGRFHGTILAENISGPGLRPGLVEGPAQAWLRPLV
jgi:hypothetical protein